VPYALPVILLAFVVVEKVAGTTHMEGVTSVCDPNGSYVVCLDVDK